MDGFHYIHSRATSHAAKKGGGGGAAGASDTKADVKPTAAIGETSFIYGGNVSEVPFSTIVEYYKHSLKFKLAVMTYMARSVGVGFYNTADTTVAKAQDALDIVNDFCEDWNLDEKNQLAARDAWMSGNFFWNKVAVQEGNLIDGLFMLPLSSFTRVNRTEAGDVVSFIQSWGGRQRTLPAGDILHFKWLPIDESAFGEGIGQSLARRGVGYVNDAGNIVQRPSWFEVEEKVDDVAQRMIYAGLPRYYAMFPNADVDFIDDVNSKLNKMDPLQHFISSVEGEITTISLDTQSRFDSFIRHVDDAITTGTQSPLIRLWSSLDFTFASSKEAIKAMDPTVDMYQRAHKRFVEKMIYYPLLIQNGFKEPKKFKLRLNWGQDVPPTIEELTLVYNMLKDPMFLDKFDPVDFIKMLQERGVKIAPVIKKDIVQTTEDLQAAEDQPPEETAAKLQEKDASSKKKSEEQPKKK